MKEAFRFEYVWGEMDLTVLQALKAFWLDNHILSNEKLDQRAKEAVIVIFHESGKIAGVSTVFKSYFDQIKNNVYVFRCFIAPAFRVPALDTKLAMLTHESLEKKLNEEVDPRPVGLLMVVQNEEIKRNWSKAIWPDTNMVFIGTNPQGDHLRIRYFNEIKI